MINSEITVTSGGYVYLIHALGTNRYKIGLTRRTPEIRLAELNSGQSPYYLQIVTAAFLEKNLDEFEDKLHQRWFYRRVKDHPGMKSQEWFKLSAREVAIVTAQIHRVHIGFSPIYFLIGWVKYRQRLLTRWQAFQLGFALGCAIALSLPLLF